MKKVLLLLAVLAFCLPAEVLAEYRSGDFIYELYNPTNGDAPYAVVLRPVKDPGSEVVIPESVKLNNVTYAVTEIGSNLFSKPCYLSKLTLPPTIKCFRKDAFLKLEGCTELHISNLWNWTQAVFENEASNPLRDKLMVNGSLLTYLNLPSAVTEVSDYAFYNYEYITSLTLSFQTTRVGKYAFYGCPALRDVKCFNGLKSIDDYAFYNCPELENVKLAEGLESIGRWAFAKCNKITTLEFPSSISSVGSNSLAETGLINVAFPATDHEVMIGWGVFAGCKELTYLKLPETTPGLYGSLIAGCDKLTSLWIPPAVREMCGPVFRDCPNLERLDISDLSAWCKIDYLKYLDAMGNPIYPMDNVLFDLNLKLYLNGEPVTNLVIPSDITEIKARAFSGIKGLESVVLPDNVVSVGEYAFNWSFRLTMSNSVTSVGTRALPGLSVYYNSYTPQHLYKDAFWGMEQGTLYIPKGTLEVFCNTSPWLYFGNIVEVDFSSLDEVEAVDGDTLCDVYSVAGIEVRAGVRWADWQAGLTPGIYIVRLADGTVRKAAVRGY